MFGRVQNTPPNVNIVASVLHEFIQCLGSNKSRCLVLEIETLDNIFDELKATVNPCSS